MGPFRFGLGDVAGHHGSAEHGVGQLRSHRTAQREADVGVLQHRARRLYLHRIRRRLENGHHGGVVLPHRVLADEPRRIRRGRRLVQSRRGR